MKMDQLPTWEWLAKQLIWDQLSFVHGFNILDFGSGSGSTAAHFSQDNQVVAIEPCPDNVLILTGHFKQFIGSSELLTTFPQASFDCILCHNVLEYIVDQKETVQALSSLLKPGGYLSIVKHHRPGRVMQMAVLLNHFEHAKALLAGQNGKTEKYGEIHYYEDEQLLAWCTDCHLKEQYGLRTFFDLQQNQDIQTDPNWRKQMLELEKMVSQMDPYYQIAFFHHLILQKEDLV